MAALSALVLTAPIVGTLLLTRMEALRARLVASGGVASNPFAPDSAGLSPFMRRLARTHANCLEGLPRIGRSCC